MNTQNSQELSDAQLDTISGGSCYRPEPPKYEPPKNCYGKDYYKEDYGHCYEPPKGCWQGWKKYFQDHKDYDYCNKY